MTAANLALDPLFIADSTRADDHEPTPRDPIALDAAIQSATDGHQGGATSDVGTELEPMFSLGVLPHSRPVYYLPARIIPEPDSDERAAQADDDFDPMFGLGCLPTSEIRAPAIPTPPGDPQTLGAEYMRGFQAACDRLDLGQCTGINGDFLRGYLFARGAMRKSSVPSRH